MKVLNFFMVVILLMMAFGCGKGVEGPVGGSLTPNFVKVGTSGTTSSLRPDLFAGLRSGELVAFAASNAAQTLAGGAGGLESLKYFIQDIQLCEDLTIQGSAYQNPRGCTYIYRNSAIGTNGDNNLTLYNNYTITESQTDTAADDRFTDLMTTAGLAKLKKSQNVQSDMLRTYNYGLVTFFRTIRMKAHFKDSAGTILYRTRANTTVYNSSTDSAGRKKENTYVGDMTASPSSDAEEVIYMMDNGGQFFKLNTPFTLTQSDLSAGTSFTVDLVFNPDNFVAASPQGGTCSGSPGSSTPPIFDNANCLSITPKFVKLTPVPRKGSEKTRKEVYRINNYLNLSGTTVINTRIELYYNDGDPDKKIQGVDVADELAAISTTLLSSPTISSYSAKEEGGTVSLLDYQGSASLTGLKRGQSATVTVTCMNQNSAQGCTAQGQTVNFTATYVGDYLVSTD